MSFTRAILQTFPTAYLSKIVEKKMAEVMAASAKFNLHIFLFNSFDFIAVRVLNERDNTSTMLHWAWGTWN